ncbi:MAG: hypothetical protein IKQ60_10090 [Candidatus Methanomethylophilaceae archaeon]|nr:hypothetical protein [Candidatus Methanomethylophilaceae archaeon]
MFRNAFALKAMAALLLVSALAMFCVLGSDGSDAAGDSQLQHPMGLDLPDGRGPAPSGFGQPEGPFFMDLVHLHEPPRYVIDAPDRPGGMPERVIDDYGRMFEEKRGLEDRGAKVFVYDPGLERDAGKDLADMIRAVMDGAVVSEMPSDVEVVPPSSLPEAYGVEFLELLLEQAGEGTELGQTISAMIAQRLASRNGTEGAAPSSGREGDLPAALPESAGEGEDDEEPAPYVDVESEHEPSSEAYLVEHGFDGGTFF